MKLGASVRRGALTPALPVPYPVLEHAGLRLRHGQVSLTVAAPGVGKSQLWLNLAERMGLRTLYWSGDTDAHDVMLRVTSLWSGQTADEIEHNYNEKAWADWYAERLRADRHVEWVFDPSITSRVLTERVAALAEPHGAWPALVVVDNLSNTVQHEADERLDQQAFIKDAQRLARESGAHVALLSHAAGEYENGEKPIPQAGVLNKLAKIPEIVLTLHRASEDGSSLGVNIVKQRGGSADPAARHPVHLSVDWSRATINGARSAA